MINLNQDIHVIPFNLAEERMEGIKNQKIGRKVVNHHFLNKTQPLPA